MKDIIILEQCKVCHNNLILRESACIKDNKLKTYVVKYCRDGCIPLDEIIEVKSDNDNKLEQQNKYLKSILRQLLDGSTGRNNGMGMMRSYKILFSEDVYDDIKKVINE